ncbi:Hypothetical protein R9X50_00729300 [Acrodontium crateriforme]|uniref:Uncharacterized protein n=1 Tax=Acrodontium crateriforme TaxID=150365 RepID=A0AAQ3MB95_9PEZI|nr:Hypothetical protein R9X50_00729300 [Acrodontium crateriforme]
MWEFVDNTHVIAGQDERTKQKIRRHVMRNYRRQQRGDQKKQCQEQLVTGNNTTKSTSSLVHGRFKDAQPLNVDDCLRPYTSQFQTEGNRLLYQRTLAIEDSIPKALSNPSETLCWQLDIFLPRLCPHASWLKLLRPLLGHVPHTDLATQALATSLRSSALGRTHEVSYRTAILNYARAVSALRQAFDEPDHQMSDWTLLSVALLAMCEILLTPRSSARARNVRSHWQGVSAIFLARPEGLEMSSLATALWFAWWEPISGIPTANGASSPFERRSWIMLKPPESCGGFGGLVAATNELLIWLPRLIQGARMMAMGLAEDGKIHETVRLARNMLKIRDEEGETAAICRAPLVKTKDEELRAFSPFQYQFSSAEELYAMSLYWGTRAWLIGVCLSISHSGHASLDLQDAMIEYNRNAANILMCWESAEAEGAFVTLGVTESLIHAREALRHMKYLRGVPTATVRSWILSKLGHEYNAFVQDDVSEAAMDTATRMLLGGPMRGFIAKT